ncbi:ABC transporter ATP-binding protein [Hymenobacter actinosclerus]|uniref:Putrescine transport system ATP-binding protein n=1 Tax=Hymenobacter actinosclerus TaxID=82805 RepID=A0A1I0ES68_9BACT|nr:ATP-binding cassette domain-containing protein [Hymenobacter actinosclerus]SET47948.1 putrescine transport system ATP-binding protein [Hymenobacter actinosclerus]
MLTVSHLSKQFNGQPVLRDISLTLAQGEVLAVLGRSGCGKTTLLKILAGIETADAGTLELHGQDLLPAPPNERQMVYLYQEPLLFPHLSVFENVAFGLRIRKVKEAEIKQQVTELLAELELSEHARKSPHQLSGGQRQRVSFGRALIIRPRLLLLDEPFGNLDAQTRAAMQELFGRVSRQHHITSIFVTHDSREALTVGSRLGYLERGSLTSFASVADFVADPRTNIAAELSFWENIRQTANPTSTPA